MQAIGKEQCATCDNWNEEGQRCGWVAVIDSPKVKITAQEGNMGVCPLYESEA